MASSVRPVSADSDDTASPSRLSASQASTPRLVMPGQSATSGPHAAGSSWIIQAAAMRLVQLLAAWAAAPAAAAAAAPPAAGTAAAAPAPALQWPGVARVAGCPSTCVKGLVALCPGITSLGVDACDALSLLDDAVSSLSALTDLTELVISTRRSKDDTPGALICEAPTWRGLNALTGLRRLVVDCRWQEAWLCSAPAGLTALTELRAPLSSIGCRALAAATGLRYLALLEPEDDQRLYGNMPRLPGLESFESNVKRTISTLPFRTSRFLCSEGEPAAALTQLSLPNVAADQSLLEAASRGSRLHTLGVTFVCTDPEALVAAACVFRDLRFLNLVQGHGADPSRRQNDELFTDAHLAALEAARPPSLERVTLGGGHGVTRKGADAVARRAEARGLPLQIRLSQSE
ncbi:MAG: hypothetical protein J3K34DRAFT_394323 [Monoraphidium minutum]|nr:MAG: hypothetical protein J3K34DRAFT_394323 [Monoraphidium minutum]